MSEFRTRGCRAAHCSPYPAPRNRQRLGAGGADFLLLPPLLMAIDRTMTDTACPCMTRRLPAICHALLAGLAAPLPASAASPEEAGLKIATEAYERNKGFGKFTASQTMVQRNKQGWESRRQLRIKVLETEGAGNRSLFVFNRSGSVKGTTFLTHAYKNKAAGQWLYLPALKRVKRIISPNRSGSFMGSEFSYEDPGAREVTKYTYRYRREEACGTFACTLVEQVPAAKRSACRRQIVRRDKKEMRAWKIACYDRKNAHLKTLTFGKYTRYPDRCRRAGEMRMVNHLTGKSTAMPWSDYRVGADLEAREFTRTGLKQVC